MKDGAEQLIDWMDRRGFNQREAGEYFGWDETFISQLRNRKRTPGLANAVKIERETGIPIEAWLASGLDSATDELAEKTCKRR